MMNRAASAGIETGSSSESLRDHVSTAAQRQLDALRAALELRLSALEAALANPAQYDSLESLILDLSRVATEEAQAATWRACVDTKLEAETRLATARAAADAALGEERAASSELRRALEAAERRLSTLEGQTQDEVRAIREQLEAQLAEKRTLTANIERALAEAQQHLKAERACSSDLRRTIDDARKRVSVLESEKGHAVAAHDQLAAELTRDRAVAAEFQRALGEARQQLEAERASSSNLRRAVDDAQQRISTFESEGGQAAHEQFAADVEHQRVVAADLQRTLEEAQTQLEAERAASAHARQLAEQAEQRLSMAESVKVQTLTDYEQLAAQLERERIENARPPTEAMAEAQRELASARAEVQALRHELDAARQSGDAQREAETRHEKKHRAAEPRARDRDHELPRHDSIVQSRRAETTAPAPASPSDDKWTNVRQVARYYFREEIEVEVDRGPGLLVDLSVEGCQVVSPATLKPNRAVKVLLPLETTSIACSGKVMWARIEPASKGQPLRYRAGVRFTKVDKAAIAAFLAHYGDVVSEDRPGS